MITRTRRPLAFDRLAMISRHDGRVVALASYAGLREPGVADVAFAVADDDQHRGIGMRMLEQLAELVAERGIHRFDAEVMANSGPMLGVFERAGFAVRRRGSFGELMVSLDITRRRRCWSGSASATISLRSHRCEQSSRPRR